MGVDGSPGSRAWSFLACLGVRLRGVLRAPCNATPLDVAFRLLNDVGTPNANISPLNTRPAVLLSTLRWQPHGWPRMTRGQDGSLTPMMVCLLQSCRAARGDQREAAPRRKRRGLWVCICPLSLLIGKSSERPAAVPGAGCVRGGGKSFAGLKRFSGAHPGRRGPFWNMGQKGKRAGARHPIRPLHLHTSFASTKFGKSSNTHLFLRVR